MTTRESLPREIESTRLEFNKLLDRPGTTPEWTIGEVDLESLFHYVTTHFRWHASQVGGALPGNQ